MNKTTENDDESTHQSIDAQQQDRHDKPLNGNASPDPHSVPNHDHNLDFNPTAQHAAPLPSLEDNQSLLKPQSQPPIYDKPQPKQTIDSQPINATTTPTAVCTTDAKTEHSEEPTSPTNQVGHDGENPQSHRDPDSGHVNCATISAGHLETANPAADAKIETTDVASFIVKEHNGSATPLGGSLDARSELENEREPKSEKTDMSTPQNNACSKHSFLLDDNNSGLESGTEEEQLAFMKDLENFFRERSMEFKPPKFYGEGLNCLKLWRIVMRLGGYDKVTSCKLWRQVGECFDPPKTCTTVSWTFRGFYEKALLDYERHKIHGDELHILDAPKSEPMSVDNQASGSGRAQRNAATRARQGWHSQHLLGNVEGSDPIIKDKNFTPLQRHEKQLKGIGSLKRKKPSFMENAAKAVHTKASKTQLDVEVVDIGPPADWVKINVLRTKDSFEVYALVPGLLREEVRVQSDPAGRLVISGEPEHADNPWGVTSFKKVVNLPSRIHPHETSAVVTLHGQLFIRVPFE